MGNWKGNSEEIKCRIGIGAAWEVGRGYGFHIKGQGRESGTGDREGVRVKRTESQGNGNRTARGKKLLPERGKPQPPHRLEGGGEIGRVGGDDATDGYRGRRMVAKQKRKKKQGPVGGKIERVGEGACNGTAGATVGNTPEMAENTPPHWAPGRWPQDGWGGHLC